MIHGSEAPSDSDLEVLLYDLRDAAEDLLAVLPFDFGRANRRPGEYARTASPEDLHECRSAELTPPNPGRCRRRIAVDPRSCAGQPRHRAGDLQEYAAAVLRVRRPARRIRLAITQTSTAGVRSTPVPMQQPLAVLPNTTPGTGKILGNRW